MGPRVNSIACLWEMSYSKLDIGPGIPVGTLGHCVIFLVDQGFKNKNNAILINKVNKMNKKNETHIKGKQTFNKQLNLFKLSQY